MSAKRLSGMNKKKRLPKKASPFFIKFFLITVFFGISALFVTKFAGPAILKLYIQIGIGDCEKIPILCMAPSEGIINTEVDADFLKELIPSKFPAMVISVPKGFTVVQERVKKVYYMKGKKKPSNAIFYVDRQEPDFLIKLFPKLKKYGIKNDFDLMKCVMFAKINNIKNFNDAFFVILKSIFIPDLADQRNVRMIQVAVGNKKSFVNYNTGGPDNYFDCNVFDDAGAFFKIYIKDKGAKLDINKVLTIISTASEGKGKVKQ